MWGLVPLIQNLMRILFCGIFLPLAYCSALVSGNVKTLQAAACETEDLMIKCPATTSIHIQFANYGRLVSSRERPCHNAVQTGPRSNASIFHASYDVDEESRDCKATQSQEKVVQLCQDKRACRVPVNAETFKQDPCPKTWKYLEVAYKCKPNVFLHAVVCEGEERTLDCPLPSHRLAIHSVMFGRDRSGAGAACTHFPSKKKKQVQPEIECVSSFAPEIAMTKCQNERSCTLTADEQTFGNQCPPGTSKYLTISYACVPQKLLISPLNKHKDLRERPEEKAEDYLGVDHDEENSISLLPVQSIDMQAIQPDYPQNSGSKGRDHAAVQKMAIENRMPPCNCTENFSVVMDWIIAYQKIKQNKEACILYACLSAGIGLLLLMLLVLIHLLVTRRSRAKAATTTVISQSSSKTLSAKTKEQRIPLYSNRFPDENDETEPLPVDLTRYAPRNTLPRAASLQVDARRPAESRSLHRLSQNDGSFYS